MDDSSLFFSGPAIACLIELYLSGRGGGPPKWEREDQQGANSAPHTWDADTGRMHPGRTDVPFFNQPLRAVARQTADISDSVLSFLQ